MATTSKAAKSKKPASNTRDANWNYELTVAKVEDIVAQIESGELELGDVFEKFEQAAQYLKECDAFLVEKREQVDLIIETLTDGTDN